MDDLPRCVVGGINPLGDPDPVGLEVGLCAVRYIVFMFGENLPLSLPFFQVAPGVLLDALYILYCVGYED